MGTTSDSIVYTTDYYKSAYNSQYDYNKATFFNDRIINLRFTIKDSSTNIESKFTVRSDFEFVYPNVNKYITGEIGRYKALSTGYIRKCQYKPSIRVQFKRVSLNVSTEIDVSLSNFYMLDSNGQIVTNFNNIKGGVEKLEVAMGYFKQFERLYVNKAPSTVLEFNNSCFDNKEGCAKQGITLLEIDPVLYTQVEKLPPDMELRIKGCVGNLFAPLNISEATFTTDYEKVMASNSYATTTNFSSGNSYIERRLREITSQTKAKYYISSGARKEFENWEKSEACKKDSDGNIADNAIVYKPADDASIDSILKGTLAVCGLGNVIDVVPTNETNLGAGIYLVTKAERNDIEHNGEVMAEVYAHTPFCQYWNNRIPAVYSINNDAICTISCPFFSMVNPFEKMYFKSRYAMSGLVQYYANITGIENEFYALWINVNFATVDDINECSIACTGQRRSVIS